MRNKDDQKTIEKRASPKALSEKTTQKMRGKWTPHFIGKSTQKTTREMPHNDHKKHAKNAKKRLRISKNG